MAYKVINGKLVKVNNKTTRDPNIDDLVKRIEDVRQKLNPKDTLVNILSWKALTPQILADEAEHYKAKYKDTYGEYLFEIVKTSSGYTVISDGNITTKDNKDKDYIIWNYECQLANYQPKVLA